MRNIYFKSLLCLFLLHAVSVTAQWQKTNGPYGGLINCTVNNQDEIYVGTGYGGIYRSTTNGQSWVAKNNGLASYGVSCMAMEGELIFAAAGPGGNNLYKSNDNGDNWTLLQTLWTSYSINCIEMSGNDVYVGTAGGGFYASHDGGSTWVSAMTGIVPYMYYSCQQVYIANGKVFGVVNGKLYYSDNGAATWTQLYNGFAENSGVLSIQSNLFGFFVLNSDGIYFSSNGGFNWANLNANIPYGNYPKMTASNNVIYVTGTTGEEVYYSIDGGFQWSELNQDWVNNVNSIYVLANGKLLVQTSYVDVSYNNSELAGLFLTEDNGANWQNVTNEITNIYGLSMTSLNGDLFVGTNEAGLFKSSNDGDSWENMGLSNKYLYTMEAFGSTLLTAADGVARSTDGGVSWTNTSQGIESTGLMGFAKVDDDIFTATPMGVAASVDDGQSWFPSNFGIESPYVYDMASVDLTLYAVAGSGIYKSTNYGNSWLNINNDLPNDFSPGKIDHNNGVLLLSGNSGIYKSLNGGLNWISMNFQLGNVTSFETYENLVFVSTVPHYVVNLPGVFMTPDLGTTWYTVNEGIDNNMVLQLLLHEDYLYAVTLGSGVYKRPISEFVSLGVESSLVDAFQLYPNPANDEFNIVTLPGMVPMNLIVTNAVGARMVNSKILKSGTTKIGCADWASGIYLITVGNVSKRVVVN